MQNSTRKGIAGVLALAFVSEAFPTLADPIASTSTAASTSTVVSSSTKTAPVSPLVVNGPQPPAGDEISQGLWWLYNLQYEKAHDVFDQYSKENPNDPAGPFYKAATDWWQLAQQFDYPLPEIQARFEKDFQDTQAISQALLKSTQDKHQKALAYFYWGGAEGLKGRLLVSDKQWVKAYFLGKDGHKRLVESLKYDSQLYDAYMGLGIYDYYTDIYGGLVGALAKILVHGDRKRGIQEIQLAIDKGTYAPGEARMFLVEIYTFEEKTPEKAIPYVRALLAQFPNSPAMTLAEITTYYVMGDWSTVAIKAQAYLDKSAKEVPYYKKEGVRPALYCLGVAMLYGKKDLATCEKYMQQILDMGIDSNRWATFAYLRLGQVHDARGERDAAVKDYQTVLDRRDFWGSHQEANAYLKTPYAVATSTSAA